MRKMLTSKLKSNESLFLAAEQKHFALCLHSAEGQLAASSLPPHHTPTCWSSNPPQHPRGWVMDGRRAISPPPGAFSKREICGVFSLPTLSSITMERKITIGSCSFSKVASQKRPSAVSVVFNKLSQVCDDMWPYPSPFVWNQVGFSSSSFPDIFPYLHGRSWYTEEGREKHAEKEIWA